MSRESIIEKLESIDGVDVSDIIQDVQNAFDDMEDLRHDLRRAKDDLDDKEEEIEVLEETVEELESKSPVELEDLLRNIDYVPINELEDFVAKYRNV